MVSLLALTGIASCESATKSNGKTCADVLAVIRNLSPTGEAKSKIQSGDYRFLAIHNYSTFAPGVDHIVASGHGYRIMRKTSDIIDGDQCEEYQEEAYRFAEAYNHEIVYLSQTKGLR
jgi:hypothetical protein